MEPVVIWEDLPQFTEEVCKDGEKRTFVITEKGLPGWVSAPTINRKYKLMKDKYTVKSDDKQAGAETEGSNAHQRKKELRKVRGKGKERV